MISFLPLLAVFTLTAGLNDSQVLQRDANGAATALVSGKTDTSGRLHCRVNDGSWSPLARVKSGDWKARLPPLRTGGPYTVQLKLEDDAGKAVEGKTYREIYVGDLWVLAGQSNMLGRAKIDEAFNQPDARVRMLSVDGIWQLAAHPLHEPTRPGAGPGFEFGKAMARSLNIPIGLLPCAKGGTSMKQWSPTLLSEGSASLYGNLVLRVRQAGGKVAGILWYQGENDTGPEPAAVYKQTFQQFVAKLRADLELPNVPFYYAQLARFANRSAKFYEDWQIVREAQRASEAEIPHARMVATLDLEQGDHVHLNRESEDRLGRRFALAAQGKAGPRLVDARWTSPNEIRLRLSGINGTLTAVGVSRLMGFEATTGGEEPRYLIYRTTFDNATSEIVLTTNRDSAAWPVAEAIDLWYGRGLDPSCNLTDSADLALPAFGPLRMPPRPPAPPRVPAANAKKS